MARSKEGSKLRPLVDRCDFSRFPSSATRLLHPLFTILASVTSQELARQVAYLKVENQVLRARLPKRIVATDQERRRLIREGRRLGTRLRELMTIVSYDTFRCWMRETGG